MIQIPDYFKEFNTAITICDINATVIYMNDKSKKTFEKWGGVDIIGKSLYDCHNENSCKKIKEILSTGIPNCYTIEKAGIKKLIHQAPWYENGKIAGLIETSIEIPFEMPHFIRS